MAAERQRKSTTAFRTISEVSEELDVPQHVLRFWETKFGQVRPMKRGGGRRYYRPEDVDLLRRIRELLYGDGYTIKGVQKILRHGGTSASTAPGEEPACHGGDAAAVSREALEAVRDDLREIRTLLARQAVEAESSEGGG